MKKYYYSPEAEIILFDTDDVIDGSGDEYRDDIIDDDLGDGDWLNIGDSQN